MTVSLLILLLPIFCSNFLLDDIVFQKFLPLQNTSKTSKEPLRSYYTLQSLLLRNNSTVLPITQTQRHCPPSVLCFPLFTTPDTWQDPVIFFLNRFSKRIIRYPDLHLNSPPALQHCFLCFHPKSETKPLPFFLNVDLPFSTPQPSLEPNY